MDKVKFTRQTDIEEYLNNDFNLWFFKDLKGRENNPFEPLQFFNLLYELLDRIEREKKPLLF